MKQIEGNTTRPRPRVVIVGAGFAGLNATQALRKANVDVLIIDRNNYHKFQPLLYQVATSGLEPEDIAHNARDLFRDYGNISFRLGTVKAIDADQRRLHLHSGDAVTYDYLILAAGAVTNYFGIDGVQEYGFPLKNLPDAIDLRNHILRQFEQADRANGTGPEGALTFVIVGGGPTGVEMAGALVELFDIMQKDYRNVDTTQANVVLLEMAPHLLPPYPESLRTYTRTVLEKRNVDVRTETTVEKVTKGAVHLKSGETIPTQTLIWAAGIRGNPIAETMSEDLEKGYRLGTKPDLSVPGYSDVFVAGDMAGHKDDNGDLLPQVAQVAIQQGAHAARQILRRIKNQPTEAFHYKDLGQMATIGRNAAVVEFPGGMKLKGFFAWFMWAFVHIWKLVGFRNRLDVFISWIHNYFTYDRSARLILDMVPISDEIPHDVEYVNQRVKERMEELEKG
ncbi:MAG TPA: NAD(P)/FAD-dependent oxidoreductase [Rhodothermales bacterium]|nr:NAD(P)/FAD-dependent oxidoreductase [Rhodothermales bacterium]